MASTNNNAAGGSPLFILFIVFLVLKLTSVIHWSWWFVTAPLWVPIALAAVFFGLARIASHFESPQAKAARALEDFGKNFRG